jgi:hypothetical protein
VVKFAPKGVVVPSGIKLTPRGEYHPFAPPFFLNSREYQPLGVINEGVKQPKGSRFTPVGREWKKLASVP